MGNLLSNPEVREEKWCIDGNRTCAQCVANHVTYSETDSILHQLLRLSMAYGVCTLLSKIILMKVDLINVIELVDSQHRVPCD